MKKRIFSMLLVVCMVFTLFPMSAFATGNVSIGTSSVVDSKTPAVCENHKEHDETCGYMEAVDGAPCSHLNEDGTYSCAPVLDSGVSGNEATPSDADKEYVCDHSDDCGYVESIDGADCTHQCELCKPAEEITPPAVKDCDCTVKCTLADEENGIEESLNADCPVCSVDGADLAACKGEAVMAMIMPLSTLTDLSDAVSGGTVSNSTKITATAASGNKLYYEFSDLLVSGAYDMVVNIDNPNLTAVISGADISAKAGRFLVVYEVEATGNKLRGFACVKLEGKYYTDDTPNGEKITTALDFTTDSGNTPPADCTAAAIGHTHSDPADKCFTWDDGTDTLTLNNLNLETTEAIAIKLPADTTVNMGAADSISTVKSTFSGGNITYGIYGAGALDFSGNGTLTTTGGTATSNSYGVYTNSGNIVVSGGTFEAKSTSTGSLAQAVSVQPVTSSYTNVKLSAGALNSLSVVSDLNGFANYKHIKIEQGAAASGVAEIGTTGYPTLAAAVATVTEDDTIKLNKDVIEKIVIPESNASNFTLDLNGKTLDGGNDTTAIAHNGTGTLIIKDSAGGGKVTSNAVNGQTNTISLRNGSAGQEILSIIGGTVESIGHGTAISNLAGGTVNVSGGTINGGSVAILNAGTGEITVTGGEVNGNTGNAIFNQDSGLITISGTAKVTSANTSTDSGTIELFGGAAGNEVLKLTGGTVMNTAYPDGSDDSKGGIAIFNGGSGIVTMKSGTYTIRGNGKAMNKAPTVDTGVTLTASTDVGGTPTVTYNAADIANYKYLKAEPGISAKITNTLNFTESTDTQDCTNTESHWHFHQNHTHADGSKCWSWNKDSRTLTLNNVDIEVENKCGNGINLPGDSKIEFTGVNTIKGGCKGILGSGSLEISGSGSLNVMGGDEPEGAEGIMADTLTLSGENANYTVTQGEAGTGYAINAAATLQCGTVTAKRSDGLLSLFLKEPILYGMIHKADTGTWDNKERDCIYKRFTDADAVAVAKEAMVNGTVEVANGADQAAKTAAVQGYVDSLIETVPNAAGVTAAVSFISGNSYSVALSKNNVNESITITVTVNELPAETHTVTYSLTNLIAAGQPASVADGDTLHAVLTAAGGYTLPDSITVTMDGNGSPTYIYTKETGAVEVSNVTGNVVITASGTPVQGSVDTSSIDTAIAAANAAKNDIAVNDNPASSVINGTKFVTTAEMKALTDAIAAATAAKLTVISTAEAQAAAGVLNSAVATFKAAIKTGTYTSGGSGDSGGSGGGAAITITDKNITDAYNQALADAKQNGNEANGITLVLNVNTGNKTVSSATVNLPKTAQETIISKQIVSTVVVIDSPDIKIGMDLNTIKEINKQANADVNITAVRKDNSKLTGNAKAVIGSRPVFDLSVTYGNGKTVNNFGGGSVTITLPYTLQAGEKAGNVCAVYMDTNGNVNYIVASSYDVVSKSVLFSTNHFSIYGVGYKTDVPAFADIADHWAKTDVEFVTARGLLAGTSTTTFSPNTSMTRGMFVTALGRMANIDTNSYKTGSFTDVKADAYYAPYVNWAASKGIVSGIGNGQFAPDRAVTREQMAVIMANYAKEMGYTVPKTHNAVTFADSAAIGSWSSEDVKAMQQAGIIMGKDGNCFDPTGTATRAEVSAVLHRYVELVIDPATTQGWIRNDTGHWLYYKEGNVLPGGWQTVDGRNYYFNADGTMHEGWKQNPSTGKWFYYTNEELAVIGWKEIAGKWYYFNADGTMAVNTKIDGWYIGADGQGRKVQ